MCSACCIRVQKKAMAFNEKSLYKKRVFFKMCISLSQTVPNCPAHSVSEEKFNSSSSSKTPKQFIPFAPSFVEYTLEAKRLFSGIGADEMCGGYVRYQTAYTRGSYEESWREMCNDWNRLWYRNLVWRSSHFHYRCREEMIDVYQFMEKR